jgi:hypothetical protein
MKGSGQSTRVPMILRILSYIYCGGYDTASKLYRGLPRLMVLCNRSDAPISAMARVDTGIKLRGADHYYAAFDIPHAHDCARFDSKEPLTRRIFAT